MGTLLLAFSVLVPGWHPLTRMPQLRAAVQQPVAQSSTASFAQPDYARMGRLAGSAGVRMVAPPERPEAFVGSTFGSTSAMFYRQGTLVLEDARHF